MSFCVVFLALALVFPFGCLLLSLLPFSWPWKLLKEQSLTETIPSPLLSLVARNPLSPYFPACGSSPMTQCPFQPLTLKPCCPGAEPQMTRIDHTLPVSENARRLEINESPIGIDVLTGSALPHDRKRLCVRALGAEVTVRW